MKRILICAALSAAVVSTARAQSVRAADSLLERGRLDRAESLYYAATRVRPRDPVARAALGRYLAERGAQRVAVTLFEEALQFGGDAPAISAELAPLYLTLGDYHALAALPSSSLSTGEKARATWLDAHPTRVIAPDSVLTASYRSTGDSLYLGRLPIRVNGHVVEAVIEPSRHGLVLSDSAAGASHLRMFVEKSQTRERGVYAAAADSIGIGRLVITNAPVSVAPIKVPAIIGLGELARFAPTFDARAGRVTLHVSGSLEAPASAMILSTLAKPSEWFVLQANGWLSLRDTAIARLLRERRWTLDAKHGQLIIE